MAVQTQFMTIAEYAAADRIEIVDGEIIELSPNMRRQPAVMSNLTDNLGPYVRQQNLGRVFSEASYVLDADSRTDWVKNARTPDVSFIVQSRIEAHNEQYPDPDGPWRLAPDLAVEVISPTDVFAKVDTKIHTILQYGVIHIWVIDPQAKTVRVYTPDNPAGSILTETDTLTADSLIPGWLMPIAALFAE